MKFRKSQNTNYNLLFNFIFGIIFFTNCALAQRSNIEKSGDILQVALPIAALSSTLIWDDGQKGTLQFVKSMCTSVLITHSVKRIINKPRPNGGNFGFPSGHTSSAVTGAAFLQKRHGWKVGIPAYILAGYVGWTRVDSFKHDYWDVLGGAIVGIGSVYLFTKPYKMNMLFGKIDKIYNLNLTYQF